MNETGREEMNGGGRGTGQRGSLSAPIPTPAPIPTTRPHGINSEASFPAQKNGTGFYYTDESTPGVALNITRSLTGGLRRTATKNGLLLIVAYALLGIAWQVTVSSLFVQWLSSVVPASTTAGYGMLTVDAPVPLLAVVGLVLLLALNYLSIVAIRVFVGGYNRSVPREVLTRNVPLAVANTIVGGLVFGLLLFAGSLLVIPGIVVYLGFVFMTVFIAVEDENFLAALRHSWRLTRGNWLRLFFLFAGLFAVLFALSLVLTFGSMLVGSTAVTTILTTVAFLPLSMVLLGVLAEAFVQLQGEKEPVL